MPQEREHAQKQTYKKMHSHFSVADTPVGRGCQGGTLENMMKPGAPPSLIDNKVVADVGGPNKFAKPSQGSQKRGTAPRIKKNL